MDPLTPAERRALRARAHALRPLVSVGHHGLTPAVLHEIDLALLAHELVKIRIASADRDARDAMHAKICAALDAAPVQHIGKLLIVFRPAPPAEPEPRASPRGARKTPKAAAARSPAQRRSGERPPAVRARRRPH